MNDTSSFGKFQFIVPFTTAPTKASHRFLEEKLAKIGSEEPIFA